MAFRSIKTKLCIVINTNHDDLLINYVVNLMLREILISEEQPLYRTLSLEQQTHMCLQWGSGGPIRLQVAQCVDQ